MSVKLGSSSVTLKLGAQSVTGYLGSAIVTARVPGAPTGPVALGGYLGFFAPADDGGAAITTYRFYADGVEVTSDFSRDPSPPFVVDGTTYDELWLYVPADGSFTLTIAAVNSAGTGALSEAAEVGFA